MRRTLPAALLLLAAVPAAEGAPPRAVDYNRDVRPILADNCFACHGPDEKTRKAGLRLDTRDGLLAATGNGHAIVPGKPQESELLTRILSADDAEVMPPPKSGKKRLTAEQTAILKAWVEQGAPWSAHWAFVAPKRPAVPAVKDTKWVRNPIDAFVLARLEAEGLKPAPEADRVTLIRRLSLDLTGLPPTPAEVADFEKDTSADAYEKLVDRLLASPHYGERMAMAWLDGTRYADSNGYQADYERFMWRWRDWVIDAYNRNLPYDQFTIEQLAGDLLPDATHSQKLATGFHRNHRINTEGGIIPEEWRVETVVDRVDTTGSVWLGLTLGCARCHDHKYDPVSQKEFYQLFAFFNNVPESGTGAERPVNHPPLLKAPRPEDEARLRELRTAVARAEAAVREREKELATLLAAWEKSPDREKPGTAWEVLKPEKLTAADGSKLTAGPDGTITARGPNPAAETYTVTAPAGLRELSAVRLEVFPDDKLAGGGPGRSSNGNIVLTNVRVEVDGKPVKLTSASADFSQESYPVAHAIDGDPETGWAIFPQVGKPHDAVLALEKPIALVAGARLSVTLEFRSRFPAHQTGKFRLSATEAKAPHERGGVPPAVAAALGIPAEKRTPEQTRELLAWFRARHAGAVTDADKALAAARKAADDFEANLPTVMVMEEMPKPRDAFVLIRGQYDKKGDKVTAGVPSALPPLPRGVPANRLGLAKWIASPDHPLTARVAVNRFWERFFGAGLVRSTENFGVQGEPPTHPELLDWLAVEFVNPGEGLTPWDMKAVQKRIVTSATYRQSSRVTPELLARDPDNRLLARATRFRLPGELVRDNALAAAGLLVPKVGGPSVRPYMPQGVWDETSVYGNLRNYQHDKGEGLYRRSFYTIWKRTAAPPTMLLFDASTREVCAVRRSRTNTPLQALALLNETTFVEASRALGARMLTEGGPTPAGRIEVAFRRVLGRPPAEAESKVLTAGLERRTARFKEDPQAARNLLAVGDWKADASLDPAELAACAVTASIVLNLDEAITRE